MKRRDDMKSKSVKLMMVISLSLLLVVTFYNKTYADIKKGVVKIPVKNIPFTPDIIVFSWKSGQAPVRMMPVNEGLCALTGVSGKFRGTGEKVHVFQGGDHWFLYGQSLQGYIWAQAHCVKYKDFGANFSSIRHGRLGDWQGCGDQFCNEPEDIQVCSDHYPLILQGISGDFERGSTTIPLIFTGYVNCKYGGMYHGGLLFRGRPFLHKDGKIWYKTLNAKVGHFKEGSAVPEMKTESAVTYKRAEFKTPQNIDIKTNYFAKSHFCVIGSIFGFFHGGGERVNLAINSNGEWIMQGQSMQGNTGMSAWCFRYR